MAKSDSRKRQRVAVGRYTATLPLAPGISATLVRASYNDGLKYTEPVAVERDVPEYKVMCSQENIWSSQVDLMFEGDDLSEVVPYIGVLVKPTERMASCRDRTQRGRPPRHGKNAHPVYFLRNRRNLKRQRLPWVRSDDRVGSRTAQRRL